MGIKLGSGDVSFRLGAAMPAAVYLGSQEVWTDFVPTAPGVPTGLTVETDEDNQSSVDVSWTAPESDGGSAVTGYKLYRSLDGVAYTLHSSPSGTTATVTVANSGGQTVYIKVAAVNAIGEGSQSEAETGTFSFTAPGAPTITSAAWLGSETQVAWSNPEYTGGNTSYVYTFRFNGTPVTPDTLIAGVGSFNTNFAGQEVTLTLTNDAGEGPASAPVTVADNS
jgi:hypothetical protein